MNPDSSPTRGRRTAALIIVAALLALLSGCGTSRSAAPAASSAAAAPTVSAPGPDPARSPGRATVHEQGGVDLRITGATARLTDAGNGTVTMRVANAEGVPEHLDMVATPDGGRAALAGGRATDGSMTGAGILIQPGTTVAFGSPSGPTATLHRARGVTSGHLLPLILEFGVAGLVRVDARVTTAH